MAVLVRMSLFACAMASLIERVECPTLNPLSHNRYKIWFTISARCGETSARCRCNSITSTSLNGLSSPRPYPPRAISARGISASPFPRAAADDAAPKTYRNKTSTSSARRSQISRPPPPAWCLRRKRCSSTLRNFLYSGNTSVGRLAPVGASRLSACARTFSSSRDAFIAYVAEQFKSEIQNQNSAVHRQQGDLTLKAWPRRLRPLGCSFASSESHDRLRRGTRPACVPCDARQYFKNEVTGVGSSCLRPCRNCSSIRNCASRRSPPAFRIRTAAAADVPPVASKSSTSTTRSPAVTASVCISISAWPYSSEYLAVAVMNGSLPRLRIGTKPRPSSYATVDPKRKPRAST